MTSAAILVALIVVSLCVALLLKVVPCYWNSYCILLQSNCFRGPRAFPLIGNAYLCLGDAQDIYKRLQALIVKYESPFRIWLGPQLYFVVHKPEQIKQILNSSYSREKAPVDDMLKPWLGNGLLTARDSQWKAHRKVLQPSFTSKAVEPLVKIFARRALLVAEKIWVEEQGEECNVSKYTTRYTFDNICETTIGTNNNALDTKNCTYLETLDSMAKIVSTRMLKPWLHSDFIFKFTSMGQKYEEGLKYMHEYTSNIFKSEKDREQGDIEIKSKKSLVSLLRSSTIDNYKFSEKEIRDEVGTLTAAGAETTSSLLSFTMFVLANYPEVQDKVYKEVREICGKYNSEGSQIVPEHLNRMEFLDLVLKETQRLFPVTIMMSRHISGDINIGECSLPAGSSVLIGFYNIHRSEENWPKPLQFYPDRFLPMHPMGPRHPYAYIPFSTGVRTCIGMRYALMSAKTLIATLLLKYVIKTKTYQEAKDLEVKMNITLKPKNPIMLSFEPRNVELS